MAVAYSNSPIVKTPISAASTADVISELDAAFTLAGWLVKVAISFGFKYTITSPDGYQVEMVMQNAAQYIIDNPTADLYTGPSVVFQFQSVGGGNRSFAYQVLAHNFGQWPFFQAVIGKYQFFMSVPGLEGGGWSAIAGGIPYVPQNVGACENPDAPAIHEIWWACGGSQFPFNFRTSANCYACMSYNLNGTTIISPDNNNLRPYDGLLCLFPLTAVNTYNVAQIPWPTITYVTHNVLAIDAFLGWGFQIRGQLWDAYLQTAATQLDSLVTARDIDSSGNSLRIRSITWHSEFYSSLQLIYEITSEAFGNVAY